MSTRVDPRPILIGLRQGVRIRRALGDEPADRRAAAVLIAVPIAVAVLAVAFNASLGAPDGLLTALAFLIGAGLTMFSQVAIWRERLTARNKKIDGVASRALDEAIAHILATTLAAILAAAVLVLADYIRVPLIADSVVGEAGRRISAGLVLGLLTYIAITLWIVVNLLWDGYRRANPRIQAQSGENLRGRNAA